MHIQTCEAFTCWFWDFKLGKLQIPIFISVTAAPNFELKPQDLSGTHTKLMLFPCFKLAAT